MHFQVAEDFVDVFIDRHELQDYKYNVDTARLFISSGGLPGIPPSSGYSCRHCEAICGSLNALKIHFRSSHQALKDTSTGKYNYEGELIEYVEVPLVSGGQPLKVPVPVNGDTTSHDVLMDPTRREITEKRNQFINDISKCIRINPSFVP